jgi:hypothetical protein
VVIELTALADQKFRPNYPAAMWVAFDLAAEPEAQRRFHIKCIRRQCRGALSRYKVIIDQDCLPLVTVTIEPDPPYQSDHWYRERSADGRSGTRQTMIVALARKLLIALWRMVMTGEIPEGISLRPAVA